MDLILSESEVRLWLGRTNVRKAANPDMIPGSVLRNCADQLAGIFTKLFNFSLAQCIVP